MIHDAPLLRRDGIHSFKIHDTKKPQKRISNCEHKDMRIKSRKCVSRIHAMSTFANCQNEAQLARQRLDQKTMSTALFGIKKSKNVATAT